VLLGAPLCFQPKQSQFRDALISLVPSEVSDTDPFPGSLLSHISATASPLTFIWSRQFNALAVCRQNISDSWRVDLRECLAHLV
jgi:polyhydroxyalkanoate synthase subunit PhaC